MVADLHIHTLNSDGIVEPEKVPDIANEKGLDAVAVTDHHSLYSQTDGPINTIRGVDVISGIELTVRAEDIGQSVDLLAYGVRETEKLRSIIDRTNKSGHPENYDGTQKEYSRQFWSNFSSDRVPTFSEGIEVLEESSQFVTLAHPYRYDNIIECIKLSKHLDGIETIYSYGDNVDVEFNDMDELAAYWFDICETGGSDGHRPKDLGKVTISDDKYKKILKEANLLEYSKMSS